MNERLYHFVGGDAGPWTVIGNTAIAGPPWPDVAKVDIVHGSDPSFSNDPT